MRPDDAPSQDQIHYLATLIRELEMPASYIATYDTAAKASRGIDHLQRSLDERTPIKAATRSAVFAKLRESRWTKEDMYAGAGITTLSALATEQDAKQCQRFLDGKLVKCEPKPAQPEAEILGDLGAALHEEFALSRVPTPAPQPVTAAVPFKPRRVISRPLPRVVPPSNPITQGRFVPLPKPAVRYSRGYLLAFGRDPE